MKNAFVAVAAVLLLAQGEARAETFDLYVFGYCPVSDPLCGFATEQSYQNRVLAAVQEVNVEWEEAGISFRPTIFPIVADNFFSLAEGCDANVSDTIKAIRVFWRDEVAALYPNAVSIMVTPGANWCCSPMPNSPYVPNPPDPGDAFPNLLGIFCTADWSAYKTGVVWAHELGHYFCLRHTQTFQDPADNDPVDHDADDCCGVNDTPPDPSRKEGNKPGGDIDGDDNPINGHEWCLVSPTEGLTDDGSPHATLCDPACFLYDDDQFSITQYEPHTQAAMNYFHEGCHGPYVVNGQNYPAFSPDSVTQIRDVCLAQVPDRASMPDVCSGHGGDADNDGICQDVDNCPLDKNTSQQDQDMDGDADACDLCPMNPSPTDDIDGDGIGDICDPDKDGDTCDNWEDQHPEQGQVRVGYRFNSTCGFGIEPVYESEEVDADDDGVKSCLDVDDDNDGICDDAGPVDPNAPGQPPPPAGPCLPGPDVCLYSAGAGCYVVQGSPNDCQPDWFVCLGGGCVEFLMKLVSVINPAEEVVFDRFQIVNRKIYLPALAEHTTSQTAQAFQGEFGSLAKSGDAGSALVGGAVRLEIWRRDMTRAGGGDELVRIVGEYQPSQVILGDVTRGGWLELEPTQTRNQELRIHSVANLSNPGPTQEDSDTDGRPDSVDNCRAIINFNQEDADADGFGNRCDADIDNDLLVTPADIDLVRGCVGADLKLEIPLNEPGTLDNGQDEHPPDPIMVRLAIRCAAMDLDADGDVDATDTDLASQAMGGTPGPSARTAPDMGCGATNCDDSLACTTDYCDPFTGQCRHVAGGCDDHNACTTDSCDTASGLCGHSALTCDDGNPCTRDICDPAAGGCTTAPEPNGLPCSDGSLCTADDMCFSGQCNGRSMLCDDGDPCTADTCEPATGQCAFPPTVCDDGNPCTRDLCSATTGCAHFDEPNGTPCSDGELCTQADRCSAGICGGAPVLCDDGDLCTTDACDAATGSCVNGPSPCDDADSCTLDTCDPATGGCTHDPKPYLEPEIAVTSPLSVQWGARLTTGHWNTYRGTIPPGLMGSRETAYDQVCLESADIIGDGISGTTDPGEPPPGTAFYYVVTHETSCGEGPPLRDSAGQPGPNPSPCMTPP